jgi:hypothetical protein
LISHLPKKNVPTTEFPVLLDDIISSKMANATGVAIAIGNPNA